MDWFLYDILKFLDQLFLLNIATNITEKTFQKKSKETLSLHYPDPNNLCD